MRRPLGERSVYVLWPKRERQSERTIVLGHAYVADLRDSRSFEARKSVERDRCGQLPRPVRAEVEANHLVAIAHRRALSNHMRQHELVALAVGVRFRDRLARARRRNSLSLDDRAPRLLGPLPAMVANHRIVASSHRRDSPPPKLLQLCLELLDKRQCRARWLVSPVEHRMNRDPVRTLRRRQIEQCHQVLNMTMHTAIG